MIRPLVHQDREAAFRLVARCLGKDAAQLDPALWDWMYRDAPSGAEGPLAFMDEGEALGLLGTLPVRLATPAGEVDATWGVDIMTHPDFQHAGIGGFLIRAWDEGTPLSLSLGVSDMALAVFTAAGRTYAGEIPLYKRVLNPTKVATRKIGSRVLGRAAGIGWMLKDRWRPKSPVGHDLSFEPFEGFTDEFDGLQDRLATTHPFAARRGGRELAWRFDRQPHAAYSRFAVRRRGELLGYAVTWLGPDDGGLVRGFVADVFCPPDDPVLELTLASAASVLRRQGADTVECLATRPIYRSALTRVGFAARPSPVRFLYRVNQPSLEPVMQHAHDIDAWHVTFADSDCLTVIQNQSPRHVSP
jgi:GNAT superfamily N-acetyltransferase